VPVMVPGIAGVPGFTVTAMLPGELAPQLLSAVTVIFPFCPAAPVVTVIEVVPAPPVMDHPEGTVQVYVIALVTAAMLYICPVNPGHCAAVPVIAPGVAGTPGFTVTAKLAGELIPQPLPAVTVIFPFCPAAPVVTVIEVVPAPPVTDHPVGTDHV
jgi:hypothetical protein